MIKWIAPIFLIAILISSILNAFGIITIVIKNPANYCIRGIFAVS